MPSVESGSGESPEQEVGVPWRSPAVQVIVASVFTGPMDAPLIGPVLPEIARFFQISDAQASLVITVYSIPGILLAPVLGILADRFGRRRTLIFSLLVYGSLGTAVAFAPDFNTVLVLRFLQGCAGGSILSSIAMTIVGDLYDGAQRNAVMGATGAAASVGAAIYPALGGALASVSWRAPFVMYSVSILIAVYAYYVLEESHEERDRIGLSYLRKVVDVVPTGKAVSIYVATFGGFTLLFGAILTAMAFLLSNTYGLTSSQVGLLITVSLLITAVVSLQNGRLSLYFSDTQMISMSFIGYGTGLLGAWLAPSPIFIGAALVIFGVGHGIFLPSTINAISALAPAQFRGGVMSLRTTMLHLGQSIGPFSFAFIAATTGYHVLLLVSGGVVLTAGTVAFVLLKI